jgi:hypothetical protein
MVKPTLGRSVFCFEMRDARWRQMFLGTANNGSQARAFRFGCHFGGMESFAGTFILAAVVSAGWLTSMENPQKVLERRGILAFFATNGMTKVLAN